MDSYLTTDDANPRVAARTSRSAQTRPARRGRRTTEGADNAGERPDARQSDRLARALGWFSIGLGIAEVVAPQGVARLVGLEEDDGNHRLLRDGLRFQGPRGRRADARRADVPTDRSGGLPQLELVVFQ